MHPASGEIAIRLAALGGCMGIILGLRSAAIACHFLNLPFVLDVSTVILAFRFSAEVGVAFGDVPAWQTARLDPIEALRYE